MKRKAGFFISLFVTLFDLTSCGEPVVSSPGSNVAPSTSDAPYSGLELSSEPEPSSVFSSNDRETTTMTFPITFMPGTGGDYLKLWGYFSLFECYPEELVKHFRMDNLFPGDLVTISFRSSSYTITDSFPRYLYINDFVFESIEVRPGLKVEVDVVDGVAQLAEAGLNPDGFQPNARYFEQALDQKGKGVPLTELSKVYAGVTVDEPTIVRGYVGYSFPRETKQSA